HSGAVGAFERGDNDDLHACAQQWPLPGAESPGPIGRWRGHVRSQPIAIKHRSSNGAGAAATASSGATCAGAAPVLECKTCNVCRIRIGQTNNKFGGVGEETDGRRSTVGDPADGALSVESVRALPPAA